VSRVALTCFAEPDLTPRDEPKARRTVEADPQQGRAGLLIISTLDALSSHPKPAPSSIFLQQRRTHAKENKLNFYKGIC